MKINPSAGYDKYQTYVQSVKNKEAAQAKSEAKGKAAGTNTDKVTLSNEAIARAEYGRVAAAVASEVDGSASAARLDALRDQVQSGSYYVPTDTLASAILGEDE